MNVNIPKTSYDEENLEKNVKTLKSKQRRNSGTKREMAKMTTREIFHEKGDFRLLLKT